MFGFFRKKNATPSPPDLTTRLGRLQKGRDNLANGNFDPMTYLHGNSMCAVGGMMKVYADQEDGNRNAYVEPQHVDNYLGDIKALDAATKKMTKGGYGHIEGMAMQVSRVEGRSKGKEVALSAYDNAIMEEAAKEEAASV